MKETRNEQVALDRLFSDMERLVKATEEGSLEWLGGKVDLMEGLYLLYVYNRVLDEQGRPMLFRDLVRRACRTLRLSVPTNASAYVHKAKLRKGIRQTPLIDRYHYLPDGLVRHSAG